MKSTFIVVIYFAMGLIPTSEAFVTYSTDHHRLPLSVRCSRIQLRCNATCPVGKVNNCFNCICLPPPDRNCPRLRRCRSECQLTITRGIYNGCPYCQCPRLTDCPQQCDVGSISGNPGADGCDTCLPFPFPSPSPSCVYPTAANDYQAAPVPTEAAGDSVRCDPTPTPRRPQSEQHPVEEESSPESVNPAQNDATTQSEEESSNYNPESDSSWIYQPLDDEDDHDEGQQAEDY